MFHPVLCLFKQAQALSYRKKMDLQNLQEIQDYLQRGEYPSGLDKGEKANFRRKCKNNFKFED